MERDQQAVAVEGLLKLNAHACRSLRLQPVRMASLAHSSPPVCSAMSSSRARKLSLVLPLGLHGGQMSITLLTSTPQVQAGTGCTLIRSPNHFISEKERWHSVMSPACHLLPVLPLSGSACSLEAVSSPAAASILLQRRTSLGPVRDTRLHSC